MVSKNFFRYVLLNDESQAAALYVVGAGYALIPPKSPYPPLRHPQDHHFRWRQGRTLHEYQLVYITQGGGQFESKRSGQRTIAAGDLFVLFPGEWHRYAPDPSTGWEEYWVGFHGEVAGRLISDYPLSPSEPVLRVGVNAALVAEYVRLTEELVEEAVGYQKIIAARTHLILATALAVAQRRNFEGTEILRVIERTKCLFLERLEGPVNVEAIAESQGVGYSWFRRMFREYTGLSPAQYHIQLRINYASELLRTTSLSVATVGQKSGFDSPHYFARIFRRKTGCTPTNFRKMSR